MKFVYDFLKAVDALGIKVIYYTNDEEDPIWHGAVDDTPWWIASTELDYENAEDHKPISFRNSLGEEYHNRAGLVILVK